MRVLVVDDEPDVLLLCRLNLQYAGHEVIEAQDGIEGLRLALEQRPDLVLLDVMLPERDGISVLRELQDQPATAATPVVLLSAKAQLQDQLRGWRAGCSDYVTKPFSPADLGERLVSISSMSPDDRARHRERAIEALAGAA